MGPNVILRAATYSGPFNGLTMDLAVVLNVDVDKIADVDLASTVEFTGVVAKNSTGQV